MLANVKVNVEVLCDNVEGIELRNLYNLEAVEAAFLKQEIEAWKNNNQTLENVFKLIYSFFEEYSGAQDVQ